MSTTKTVTVPSWSIGDRLAKARNSAGLTQEELADIIGCSAASVSNYESDDGRRRKQVMLRAWAEATNVPLWWLEGTYPHQPKTVSSTWYLLKFPMQNQNVQNETLRAVA